MVSNMFHSVSAVFIIAFVVNLISSLHTPLKVIESQNSVGGLVDNSKNKQLKANDTPIDEREIASHINDEYEEIKTAESRNYVYRPLYVYRKVEHSKRRITMYNSFAG